MLDPLLRGAVSVCIFGILFASALETENLALNASARAVGQPEDYMYLRIAYGPEKAVDGNADQDFYANSCTHISVPVREPWWLVDLGSVHEVHNVEITNRLKHSRRLRNFTIAMSQNLQGEATLLDRSLCFHYHPGQLETGATVNFPCLAPVFARYVKIQLHLNSEILTLCEVRVWGVRLAQSHPVCPSYASVPGRKSAAMVLKTTTAPTISRCAVTCYRTKHCSSFNARKEGDGTVCELLEDIRELYETDVVAEPNWQYFRVVASYSVYKGLYQLEENFIDSDDDEFLGTINFDDLGTSTPSNAVTSERFPVVSDQELDRVEAAKNEKNTEKSTKWGLSVFKEWLASRGLASDFESLNSSELNDRLRRFYVEARTKDGKEYSKSALVGIRAAVNRFLNAPPVHSTINIMRDREFLSSNHVLMGVIKQHKRQGKDVVNHKEAIAAGDLQKLFNGGYLSARNPLTLLRKVWFDLTYHFGRRGREGLRSLRPDSFLFARDDTGLEFVTMAYSEADKTHHGVDSRETEKHVRMYASDDDRCPVSSLRLYLSKRNKGNNAFFQRPLSNPSPDADCWYYKQAMGVNALSSMMADISRDAGLSRRYTNHCLRATSATVLSHAGVGIHGIMSVTGHRNESSLKSYIQRPSEEQRRSLSKALHSAVVSAESSDVTLSHVSAPGSVATCTVTQTQSMTRVEEMISLPRSAPQGYHILDKAAISGGTFHFNFH